jgi:hypothetical protein
MLFRKIRHLSSPTVCTFQPEWGGVTSCKQARCIVSLLGQAWPWEYIEGGNSILENIIHVDGGCASRSCMMETTLDYQILA